MTRYASDTSVSPERSRGEIERTLRRYGADAFSYGYDGGQAIIAFRVQGLHVKFRLPMPTLDDDDIRLTPTGLVRSEGAQENALEQGHRQRWRALSLVIKAKLEAVASGVVSLEEEFLAHTMLPDGSLVGDTALPAIARAYETGEVPALLPGGDGEK